MPNQALETLSESAIHDALRTRSPWVYEDGQLVLTLRFADFRAVDRLVRATLDIAQSLDHHPDVCFGYNTLQVRLYTHDAQGITSRDLACADQILLHLGS